MTASGSQVRKTDCIHFAEIYFVQQNALCLHFRHVQLQPVHLGQIELALVKVDGIRVDVVSNEVRSVGKFQYRSNLMKSRRLGVPADSCLARQIHKVVFIAERERAR